MSRLSQSAARKTKRTEQSIDRKRGGEALITAKRGEPRAGGERFVPATRARIEPRGEDEPRLPLGCRCVTSLGLCAAELAVAAVAGFTESLEKISGAPRVTRRRSLSMRITFLPVSSTGRTRTRTCEIIMVRDQSSEICGEFEFRRGSATVS